MSQGRHDRLGTRGPARRLPTVSDGMGQAMQPSGLAMGRRVQAPATGCGEANCVGEQACKRLPGHPTRAPVTPVLVIPYTTSVDVNCTIATIQVLC